MWKGWFRENGRLIELNPNAKAWIGYSDGTPLNDVTPIQVKAPIVVNCQGKGVATYEAFPPNTEIEATFRIPYRGIGVTSLNDLKRMFEMCETAPKRGLGSNPFYYGGRFKLLSIEEIKRD
jgi:hypothetical protein